MTSRDARQLAGEGRWLAEVLGIEEADELPDKVLWHLIADRMAEVLGAERPWADLDAEGRMTHALCLAEMEGEPSLAIHLLTRDHELFDAVQRGDSSKTRLQKQAGSRKGKHKVTPDVLRASVRAHPRYGRARQWTSVTDDVGAKTKPRLSGKQVRRLVADMRW